MKTNVIQLLTFVILGSFLNACAGKTVPEVAEPASAMIVEKKVAPTFTEAEQIDYSNRIIDADFEERILSPVTRFASYQSKKATSSERSHFTCKGKKLKKMMTGVWTCKNSSGKKIISITFRKGKKNGWAREWDDRGRLRTESWWANDLLSKPARTFQGSGKRSIWGGFEKGARNGYFSKYDSNGIEIADVNYKDGSRSGRTRVFYPNKKLRFRLDYQNDQPNGEYWSWHKNGNIKAHGFMKDGTPTGNWDQWDESGQKIEALNSSSPIE